MKEVEGAVTAWKKSLQPGQLLESLFGAIPTTHYFVKNIKGEFMAGADSFAQLFGEDSMASILGKTDFDLAPDFIASHFTSDDQEVFLNKKPVINRVELVPTESGSLDWFCTSKEPLFDETGEVVGVAGITRRIDDRDEVYMHHPEMRKIVDYLRDHFSKKISMPEVAEQASISVSKQERLFRKMFGITPLMYLQKIRLNAACSYLRNSHRELEGIAKMTGFNDQTNMTRAFRTELKITPLRYRKQFQ